MRRSAPQHLRGRAGTIMGSGWQNNLVEILKTLNQILTAGNAITAFSLLLYALAFNLRDRVARSFAFIMVCVVAVFTGEAIGSSSATPTVAEFWLRLQWVGIVFLPAAYLHFSDAVLATTGRPSRGRRRWAVRLAYLGGVMFVLGLPFSYLVGPVVYDRPPAPHLQPTFFTDIFMLAYLTALAASWLNFVRAYHRTTTATSRRRMMYLLGGSVAPALGAFPFLPYSPNFSAQHLLTFWSVSFLVNTAIGVLLVVMAYSVAFFGVTWPDRVVKLRLIKWIMRGPFTASLTLAAVTLVRRAGELFGSSYTALVPIVMVGVILTSEYLITLLAPLAQRWLSPAGDKAELEVIRNLENQLLTQNDLRQFLETILAAVCDRRQALGAYVVALNPNGMELLVSTGRTRFAGQKVDEDVPVELLERVSGEGVLPSYFRWGEDELFPLLNGSPDKPDLLGLLGVHAPGHIHKAKPRKNGWNAFTGQDLPAALEALDREHQQAMQVLVERASMALRDWRIQQKVFRSLEDLSPHVDLIQRLRAAGQYDRSGALMTEDLLPHEANLANWVKDALTHYWGGPKLTRNPLMNLKIVQDALNRHEGNRANALRSILREAIDRVRPEGERRFTGEWILYNILEMKFLEGKKVREVALRLAMSEADLYRKQRIAVEAVARVIAEMEVQARKESEVEVNNAL